MDGVRRAPEAVVAASPAQPADEARPLAGTGRENAGHPGRHPGPARLKQRAAANGSMTCLESSRLSLNLRYAPARLGLLVVPKSHSQLPPSRVPVRNADKGSSTEGRRSSQHSTRKKLCGSHNGPSRLAYFWLCGAIQAYT